MNFDIPDELQQYLQRLDAFIAAEILPLQNQDDNIRFFDHRREAARTDFDNGGLPRKEWQALMAEAVRRADKAGFWRFSLPRAFGGQNDSTARGSNLWMSVIREHLASKGLGLFNDLQTEHSVVGNFPIIVMVQHFGHELQKQRLIWGMLDGSVRCTFGLTEWGHGSDATWMETTAKPATRNGEEGYLINGSKAWQTGADEATHSMIFARTHGKPGDADGITCFVTPVSTPGFSIDSYEWTFNMPTDHATISFRDVWVPARAILGPVGRGLAVAQAFVHENRIRQAASSLGAAVYCINESVRYAMARRPFGRPLAENQSVQNPLVELHTQAQMLRLLVRQTAALMDTMSHPEVEQRLSGQVSQCNFWANRLCCEAADRAMQIHGGLGYSRHRPFEHIYRHHRRYRITEGSEEIQMRKVAAYLFGFAGPNKIPTEMRVKTPADVSKL